MLLTEHGAQLESVNSKGLTALHEGKQSIERCYLHVVFFLVLTCFLSCAKRKCGNCPTACETRRKCAVSSARGKVSWLLIKMNPTETAFTTVN